MISDLRLFVRELFRRRPLVYDLDHQLALYAQTHKMTADDWDHIHTWGIREFLSRAREQEACNNAVSRG